MGVAIAVGFTFFVIGISVISAVSNSLIPDPNFDRDYCSNLTIDIVTPDSANHFCDWNQSTHEFEFNQTRFDYAWSHVENAVGANVP